MNDPRKALDSISRIEAKGKPPIKQTGTFPLKIPGTTFVVQFACFVRKADDFPYKFMVLILEDLRHCEAPVVLFYSADVRCALVDTLVINRGWPKGFVDQVLAAASKQEGLYNGLARALNPQQPATLIHPDWLPEEKP